MVLLEAAGWETTVWLQVLSAPLHATLQCLPNVLMEKLFVTTVQLEVAGWETTACQRDLNAQLLLDKILFYFFSSIQH